MCDVLSMPMSTAVGDFVNEDEVLAEIETDKVSYCSILDCTLRKKSCVLVTQL